LLRLLPPLHTARRITSGEEGGISREELQEAIAYLRGHPEVRDVLVSGGDPLLLSTARLLELLEGIRRVPHVGIVRIGTRIPAACRCASTTSWRGRCAPSRRSSW